MNKSWQLTAVFGVLSAILCAVYFLSSPPATTPSAQLSDRVIPDLEARQVSKLEVARKDGTLTFERATDLVGEHWRIAGPNSHAAETAMVQQMLFGLDRFIKTGGLDAGKPETAPELTGLAEPRLTVTFVSGGRRDVLRFGKVPPTNTTVVFYQHEGDPKIYLTQVDTFEAYNKPALQYRAKALVRYTPHRVNRVILEYKFTRLQGKDKPGIVEYEKSVMERYEEGMERGWYLTEPHRERLDDHKVAGLVTQLADLQAGDYQPAGNPKEQGFDEPQAKVTLYCLGEEKPVVVHFGDPADHGRKRWVRTPDSGEVALYEEFRYTDLPLQRNNMRTSVIFPFTAELVKRLEVEVKDLGKIVLERREVKKAGDPVAAVKWEVTEPPGLRLETERLEAFVSGVVSQQVTGFMGAQDFKLVDLDPAPVRLTIETKEGKKHVCGFSASAQGYLRKEGVNEIFEVRPELVKMLQRLELNFMTLEMFNVQRQDLREFSFESKVSDQLQPVYYKLKLDDKANKWGFNDPAHKGVVPDAERVSNLLALLNYIKAETLIGRDAKTIEKYRLLDERSAPSTLLITYVGGVADLYISQNLSDKPGRPMYYARFKDNATVFQINGMFVTSLLQPPVVKPEDK
jgi:hypothetical protein